MSRFSPVSTAAAPCAASAESGWASSHLLQAQRYPSSSARGVMSGLGPLVPAGSATNTRKLPSFAAWQGA